MKLKSCNISWSCQGKVAGSMVWPARWWNTLHGKYNYMHNLSTQRRTLRTTVDLGSLQMTLALRTESASVAFPKVWGEPRPNIVTKRPVHGTSPRVWDGWRETFFGLRRSSFYIFRDISWLSRFDELEQTRCPPYQRTIACRYQIWTL
jgi:hypothetical protein